MRSGIAPQWLHSSVDWFDLAAGLVEAGRPLPRCGNERFDAPGEFRREWAIFWRDRNLRFHAYDLFSPTPNVEALLAHVDEDPTCIFWG